MFTIKRPVFRENLPVLIVKFMRRLQLIEKKKLILRQKGWFVEVIFRLTREVFLKSCTRIQHVSNLNFELKFKGLS